MRYFLSVLLFFVFFVVVCHGTDSNFVFFNSKANSVRDVSIKDEIVSGEENLRELLKKNGLFFRLSMRKNGGKMYYGNVGQHYYDDENVHRVNGSFNASFGFLEIVNYNITDDVLYFSAQINFFKEYGSPGYREYPYPEIYDVKLTKDDVLRILETEEYFIDEIVPRKGFCRALVITDNLRIREYPKAAVDVPILGKLSKFDIIKIVDCTEEKDIIDALEYPWFKVQMDDGSYGWIFGGFAKIFMLDDEIEILKDAFKEEGSEYTNQFYNPWIDY